VTGQSVSLGPVGSGQVSESINQSNLAFVKHRIKQSSKRCLLSINQSIIVLFQTQQVHGSTKNYKRKKTHWLAHCTDRKAAATTAIVAATATVILFSSPVNSCQRKQMG